MSAALAVVAGGASAQTLSDDVESQTVNIDIRRQNIDGDNQRYVVNVTDCQAQAPTYDETIRFRWEFTSEPQSDSQYTVKVVHGSQTCDLNSLARESSDECDTIIQQQPLTADFLGVDLTWQQITTSSDTTDCENRSDIHDVSLIFDEITIDVGGDGGLALDQVRFEFRTTRPSAPSDVTAQGGEATIAVDWSAVTDAQSYDVFYILDPLVTGGRPEDIVGNMVNTTSPGITLRDGVVANQIYYVGVSTLDTFNNPSLLSEVVQASTQNVTDFYELYRGMGGADQGCATASTTALHTPAGVAAAVWLLGLAVIRRRGRGRR